MGCMMPFEWPQLVNSEAPLAERLDPELVLYEFDEPLVFTARAATGDLVLAYRTDSDHGAGSAHRRFLVAPLSETVLEKLLAGGISVHDAMTRAWLWVVDVNEDDTVQATYAIGVNDLPPHSLPAPHVMLRADLEPLAVVRYYGPDLTSDAIPASVVEEAAKALPAALRRLMMHVIGERTLPGRPENWLRALYNLPARRLSFGSLEIAFGGPSGVFQQQPPLLADPSEVELSTIEDRAWTLLRRALDWAESAAEEPDAGSDEERVALLEALRILAPGSGGVVSRVDVGGRGVHRSAESARYSLSPESKKRATLVWRAVRRRLHEEPQYVLQEGRVREFDHDLNSFILRPTEDSLTGTNFVIEADDELTIELALQAFSTGDWVRVTGRRAKGSTDPFVVVDFIE